MSGLIDRLLWGNGLLCLTDNRAFGVVISDVVQATGNDAAFYIMPRAYAHPDGTGSVIAFSIARESFESTTAETGWRAGTTPLLSFEGPELFMGFQPTLVASPTNQLVKPDKGLIAGALAQF